MQLPFHSMVVHLPMALAIVVPLIAAGVGLAWWRRWLPAQSWWLVVAMQLMLVVGSAVAMNTGESEEDRVERQVPESLIEAHEEKAEAFAWAAAIVLVVAIAAAWLGAGSAAPWLVAVSLVGMLVVAGLGVRVGHAGGELLWMHGAGKVQVPQAAGAAAKTLPASAEDEEDSDSD